MKINRPEPSWISKHFQAVEHGECFLFNEMLWMKTQRRLNEEANAVRFADGTQDVFSSGTYVKVVDAEITYKY